MVGQCKIRNFHLFGSSEVPFLLWLILASTLRINARCYATHYVNIAGMLIGRLILLKRDMRKAEVEEKW